MEEGVNILGTHHVAVICSNYGRSRRFYTEVLGLAVVAEAYRADRDSHKLDLRLPDGTQVELFSFPDPPPRPSYPEACGLRHLAFEVEDVGAAPRLRRAPPGDRGRQPGVRGTRVTAARRDGRRRGLSVRVCDGEAGPARGAEAV